MFLFILQLLSETFLILRRIKQHIIKNVYWSSSKVSYIFCHILTKFELSRQINSNTKFHENPSSGSQVIL
jgi:hypothetical protein